MPSTLKFFLLSIFFITILSNLLLVQVRLPAYPKISSLVPERRVKGSLRRRYLHMTPGYRILFKHINHGIGDLVYEGNGRWKIREGEDRQRSPSNPEDEDDQRSHSNPNECSSKYSCSGCGHVRVCRREKNAFIETFRLTCSGETPFCDAVTGACTSTPTKDCVDTGLHTCMDNGVFPDLKDCTKYHECEGGKAWSYKCSDETVFDGYNCQHSKECETFYCEGKSGIKVAHYHNQMFFAYCHHGNPLFVDKCDEDQVFYESSQKCERMESTTHDEYNTIY